ncbi:MAG: biopolymer transporter ExbD [Bacteroidales bacterium]|nr:biopolymer transporter ExbD [Candidatus Colimorpha onthohippi]
MGRKTPGLNTSSMADISFLLLTFFLMTSSINTDTGIARRLPPPLPPNQEKPEVRMRNIFVVKINSKDRLLFDGEIGRIEDLRDRAKEFLGNPNNLPNLPEKETIDIPLLGKMDVSKGVISLQNDRGTSYDMYLRVQNELAAAINEMRNELSSERFGRKYADISEEQREAIDKAIPIAISEAEPTKIGENK